ncbi:MAG TPA: glycerophosphodiester phosphodiesterase [Candidatus Pelagibacter bacterium]|jgi:glycerophosphoryl diester phosphodiesterase|nr:glycerophosphodiester phosphodiesterase [Candidatus Pelagibacter bacterium]|tara:strand:+ start:196 stop:840 length:645 start_codon:yes stop_codon:yes gene_type:complete
MSHLLIHRGLAKKNFVENTISSFRYCFKKNYGIETDIHCTKDNKIVCFHDFNLKSKFKVNKSLKDIKYKDLLKISKLKKKPIPLLKDLIKLSKNKKYLMLEIKPLFSKDNLKVLLNEVKKLKNYSLTSFKEKNIINLCKAKKSLNLGLLIPSTYSFKKVLQKSKKKYVKFLVLEKKFLNEKKLYKIRKKIYFYTIKDKKLFNKFKEKNLIFENL